MRRAGEYADPLTDTEESASVVTGRESVARVPLASLLPAISPRLGVNQDQVQALAESDSFPPIVVSRRSMRIVDGIHRFHAAKARGEDEIDVHWYDGDDRSAFLFSIRANVRQGFRLSARERMAAVAWLLRVHPEWPDHLIASTVGIVPHVVETIRSGTGAPSNVIPTS